MRRASTGYSRDTSTNKDSEVSMKVDEPVQGPSMKSIVQYFENAGSVSVESTPGMPWTFVTTDSRRFLTGVRADAGHDVRLITVWTPSHGESPSENRSIRRNRLVPYWNRKPLGKSFSSCVGRRSSSFSRSRSFSEMTRKSYLRNSSSLVRRRSLY